MYLPAYFRFRIKRAVPMAPMPMMATHPTTNVMVVVVVVGFLSIFSPTTGGFLGDDEDDFNDNNVGKAVVVDVDNVGKEVDAVDFIRSFLIVYVDGCREMKLKQVKKRNKI